MTKIVSRCFILGSNKQNLSNICKENPDWNYEKLLKKTGIENRHILNVEETDDTYVVSFAKHEGMMESMEDEDKEMMLYGSKNTVMIHFYEECPISHRILTGNRKQYYKCDWCEARRDRSYDKYAEKVKSDSV